MGNREIGQISRPDDYRAVEKRVRELWEIGESRFVRHAREQKGSRDIDNLDVQAVLKTGRIVSLEMGKEHWRYRFEGRDAEGRQLGVVVEVNDIVIVVTVMHIS